MITLAVFAFLARSRRWWGTLAVVGLCLLAVLFCYRVAGGSTRASHALRSQAVLVTSGVVGGLLSVALLLSGNMGLIDRARRGGSLTREPGGTRR